MQGDGKPYVPPLTLKLPVIYGCALCGVRALAEEPNDLVLAGVMLADHAVEAHGAGPEDSRRGLAITYEFIGQMRRN